MTKYNPKTGFTLIEMLIVAPIVLLVIGAFISAIMSMTGGVIANRNEGALTYSVQNALNSIDSDTRVSGGYLATNSISLQAGQGYNAVSSGTNSDTTAFHNVASGAEDMLILNSYATTVNPSSASKRYVYLTNVPNACNSTSVSQNSKMMTNIIYFVKNGTLWRRMVMRSDYMSAGCNTPWQKPSCNPDVTATFCKVQDTRLVDGIQAGGFDIKYYTNTDPSNSIASAIDTSLSDANRQTAISTASTINTTINASISVSGYTVSKSGQIRSAISN
jgi:type II secretory pathway pseudopilin PulG